MGKIFNRVEDAWFFDRWTIDRALKNDAEGDRRVYPISVIPFCTIPWLGSWIIETIEHQAQLSDEADAIRNRWFAYIIYSK